VQMMYWTFCKRYGKYGIYISEVIMRYTETEKDLIESILYYQWRIDKAWNELLQRHSKRSVTQKLAKVREERKCK
jgi:hypothetical protein